MIHLVRPTTFDSLIPGWLPAPTAIIVVSGVAELLCASGIVLRRTRGLAGPAAAVLLVAIFPGNVTMAINELHDGGAWAIALSLGRLPLQVPLILAAWRAGRQEPRGSSTGAADSLSP